MNLYRSLPQKSLLSGLASLPVDDEFMEVNAHLHSPYSFSAFESFRQTVGAAISEGLKVEGINDFNTTYGYTEWAVVCLRKNVFSLFNTEFIVLNKEDQSKGNLTEEPNWHLELKKLTTLEVAPLLYTSICPGGENQVLQAVSEVR